MANFLDQYNLLLDMYHGCHDIIKILDKLLDDLDQLEDSGSVQPEYTGQNIILKTYRDIYNSRCKLRLEVISYLETYSSTLSKDYVLGMGVLEELRNYLNVLDKIPEVQDIAPFKNVLPQKQFDRRLVVTLRDPLMQSIRMLSQSNSSGNKSGVASKPTNAVTSNAKAAALLDATTSHINNPVVSSATSNIRNTDVRAQEQAVITYKAQQAVQQKNVLSKLADGEYLSSLVGTVETNTPSWIKSAVTAPDSISNFITDSMGRYATRNLVLFDTLGVASPTSQQDSITLSFREQTRKKYGGNLGFCDETKDKNGNWVQSKKVASRTLLSDSRKNLRNNILGSITN